MSEKVALDVMRSAANCNHCFDEIQGIRGLERIPLGLPKPRWIGSNYWNACPRVVIVLLNPGDSSKLGPEWNQREYNSFRALFDHGDYGQLRDYFRTRRAEEVNGTTSAKPVFSWYEAVFGLAFEDIAQINMAWCASRGNKPNDYKQMLQPCLKKYTARLLKALDPNAVLLSGYDLRRFEYQLTYLLPRAKVRTTLHYQHRKRMQVQAEEAAKVRVWLEALRRATPG